jgi:hypothetical protein
LDIALIEVAANGVDLAEDLYFYRIHARRLPHLLGAGNLALVLRPLQVHAQLCAVRALGSAEAGA